MSRLSFQSTRRNVRFYSHFELDWPALAGVHGLEQLVVETDGSYEVFLSTPEFRDNTWGTIGQSLETQPAPGAVKGMG
jgi:hypothetical protein